MKKEIIRVNPLSDYLERWKAVSKRKGMNDPWESENNKCKANSERDFDLTLIAGKSKRISKLLFQ